MGRVKNAAEYAMTLPPPRTQHPVKPKREDQQRLITRFLDDSKAYMGKK